MMIVAITVLNILLAAALPIWSQKIRREKEEELIARGLQYAQAIQVFQQRYGRLPNRLEELIEVEPRCIRQLFKDPMTKDGKWGLLIGGPGGSVALPPPGGQPQPDRGRFRRNVAQGNSPGLERPGDRNGELIPAGPISGVYSLSSEKSILKFNNAQQYNEWKFDAQLLNSAVTVAVDGGVPSGPTVMPARWIGRPFRNGITVQLQQPGAIQLPQGTGPDGRPVNPNQPQNQGFGGDDENRGSSAFGTGGTGGNQGDGGGTQNNGRGGSPSGGGRGR
jgi:type II secretory pathway pseudopilin PulG